MPGKHPVIAVIGSGSDPHESLSRPLGNWLGRRDCDLINGGGEGVMAAVSRAFAEVEDRTGRVIGVIPAAGPCDSTPARAAYSHPRGYPNAWIDIPIYTHLHQSGVAGKGIASRNSIIILTADIVVALPGGEGTRSEIQLALEYGKPLLILNSEQVWEEFRHSKAELLGTVEEVCKKLERFLAGL